MRAQGAFELRKGAQAPSSNFKLIVLNEALLCDGRHVPTFHRFCMRRVPPSRVHMLLCHAARIKHEMNAARTSRGPRPRLLYRPCLQHPVTRPSGNAGSMAGREAMSSSRRCVKQPVVRLTRCGSGRHARHWPTRLRMGWEEERQAASGGGGGTWEAMFLTGLCSWLCRPDDGGSCAMSLRGGGPSWPIGRVRATAMDTRCRERQG